LIWFMFRFVYFPIYFLNCLRALHLLQYDACRTVVTNTDTDVNTFIHITTFWSHQTFINMKIIVPSALNVLNIPTDIINIFHINTYREVDVSLGNAEHRHSHSSQVELSLQLAVWP
jgi:hypothetical protein